MKIAFITPALSGHTFRGIGIYTENLYKELKKDSRVTISLKNQKDDLSSFDIIHYPYFDPFFLTLPLVRTYKTVVTVHDLIPIRFPDQFPKGIKGYIKWQIQRYSLSKSQAVITDSFVSKKDIIKFCTIPDKNIYPIHLGVGDEFKIITKKSILERTRKKLKLPERFILYVGDINYNKNIPCLLQAFEYVSKKLPDLHLIFAGIGFTRESPRLEEILSIVHNLESENKIQRLGFIEKDDLIALYNLAKIYIQPSLVEGFGLPPLEAMKCGCPVISSQALGLSEILGSAALFFDPFDCEELARKIISLYTDKEKQNILQKKGREWVKQFTWKKCCDEVINVYQSVLSS